MKAFSRASGSGKYLLYLRCVCSSVDGSFNVELPSKMMKFINGKYLYIVKSHPGSPAPTDNSDLAINTSLGFVLMYASGNGTNMVSATSAIWQFPDGPVVQTNAYPIVDGSDPLSIVISNNDVNSAVVNLILEFTD
jgi:hypothetical protein